jgi:hypothetical protein
MNKQKENLQQSHPFETDVGDVKSRKQPFELPRIELQACRHARNSRVADVYNVSN